MSTLAQLGASRDATVIALGGGVVGDLAGFAAALWMRGIAFVQIPTTLLAMVDSSVGGKTGVNLPQGKNLVGAFHQPRAVFIDPDTLRTLPERELLAGLAEVIKYAAIGDSEFMDWLEANVRSLLDRDSAALQHAIETSVRHKARVVAADEHERGERALLNLGHTFGHAIEAATGYKRFLHGEAVAIGMLAAARLSAALGMAAVADADRLQTLLSRFGLPTTIPKDLDDRQLLDLMRLDKKAESGKLRLILWRGVGRAEIVGGVADTDILAALQAMH
jgi:3-dehydroquinate synthase